MQRPEYPPGAECHTGQRIVLFPQRTALGQVAAPRHAVQIRSVHSPAGTMTTHLDRSWWSRVARFLALLILFATVGLLSGVENYYTDRALGEAATWTGTLFLQVVHWTLWGCFLPLVVVIS